MFEDNFTSTFTFTFDNRSLSLPSVTGVWNAFRCTGSIQRGQRTAQDDDKQADSHISMRQTDIPHIHKIHIVSDMKTEVSEKIHTGFDDRVW